MSAEETVKKRTESYKDYYSNILVRREIISLMEENHKHNNNGEPMPNVLSEMVWDLVNKFVRLSANPWSMDTWHDIQGYAKLGEQYLIKKGVKNDRVCPSCSNEME